MTVRIGHASISEHGTITGSAGDQTGKEVKISNWYLHSKGWVVLRCNSEAKREKIAQAAEKAAKNKQIGYDQNQRDTLFNNVKDKGFDPSKTTKKVETDCSALVRVCIAYAYGKDIAGNIRTATEPKMLVNTGHFKKLTATKYTKSSSYLKRGDILCTPVSGHTVVVLDNGSKVSSTSSSSTSSNTTASDTTKVDSAKKFDKALAGKYKVTSDGLNLRAGAGTGKAKIVVLPKDTKVENFGYYTTVGTTKWMLVQVTYKNKKYTGFCSKKYLKKC